MTLQQLEYILAVAQHRNFTKAAEQCYVTQPTLSAMIQKLEEELDAKIFYRNRQPIAPTPIGVHILQQAKEVMVQMNNIKEIIKEHKEEVSGNFHIGILPTIAPYLLPRFFQDMVKKYSKLNVTVSEMKTPDIKRALLTGELDAGILAELNDMEMYNLTHLYYEEFFAYVSREDSLFEKNTIKSTDLKGELLWLLDEGHCFRDQMVRFCNIQAKRKDNLTYQLGSMETFMRMVERGQGMTFVPELAIEQMSEQQRELVRPFAIPSPARRIVLLTNKQFIRHSLIDILQSEIQSVIPKSMHTLKPTQLLI